MFEKFPRYEMQCIFVGLKCLIETPDHWGHVFHNGDPGHSVYLMGAKGEENQWEYADSPERNKVYKMLSELSRHFKEVGDTEYNWWNDFSEWQDFCKFAVETYKKVKGDS